MKRHIYCIFFFFLVFSASPLKSMSEKDAKECYDKVLSSFYDKKWDGVKNYAKKLVCDESSSVPMGDVYYHLGLSYLHEGDYDQANKVFSQLLQKHVTKDLFEKVIVHKFHIGEAFQRGAGKHLLDFEKLPRWIPGYSDAYAIYDEVIESLPSHPVAAKALFNKAVMLRKDKKYKESIAIYESLIRKFPKNALAPKARLAIGEVYLERSKVCADRDFLELAKVNLDAFERAFPGDKKVQEARNNILQMQDIYAKDALSSAAYFIKKGKANAGLLYYFSIVQDYSDSQYVSIAKGKIMELTGKEFDEAFENVAFCD